MKYTFDWEKTAEDRDIFVRKCSICGAPVIEGYCVNDGMDYYCSLECLHMVFTDEEWEQAYNEDWGYYTEWYCEYEDDELDIICNEFMPTWKAEADVLIDDFREIYEEEQTLEETMYNIGVALEKGHITIENEHIIVQEGAKDE